MRANKVVPEREQWRRECGREHAEQGNGRPDAAQAHVGRCSTVEDANNNIRAAQGVESDEALERSRDRCGTYGVVTLDGWTETGGACGRAALARIDERPSAASNAADERDCQADRTVPGEPGTTQMRNTTDTIDVIQRRVVQESLHLSPRRTFSKQCR